MADPTPVEIAGSAASSSTTTTVNFTAQAAGTVLILSVAADNYRTTAGSGRPESTGWSFLDGEEGNLGCYVWWKIADGSETSVQYTLGAADKSAYTLVALDNMDAAPLGVESSNASPVETNRISHTTPSVTPDAGSRWCVVFTVGSTGNATSGPYAWSGAGTKLSERYTTTGYRPGVTVGTAILDGGTAVTSTVTFASTTNVNQGVGIVAAWKVAAGGTAATPLPVIVNRPALVRAAYL